MSERLVSDRGEANTLGMIGLTAALLGLILLFVAGSRANETALIATELARTTARAGSTAETAGSAPGLAAAAFDANIDPNYRGICFLSVDITQWTAGRFRTEVQCQSDVGVLGAVTYLGAGPSERTVTREWVEPIDNARIVRSGP